jgi:hypothetical protein
MKAFISTLLLIIFVIAVSILLYGVSAFEVIDIVMVKIMELFSFIEKALNGFEGVIKLFSK